MSSLALTLLYLLAAVLGVVVCRSLKLPPMLGYLAAGVLIGPNALALAQNSESVRHLGEFGVVFLCSPSDWNSACPSCAPCGSRFLAWACCRWY